MTYRKFIEETLERASEVARNLFGNVTASTKPEDNNQVLTEADLAVGRLIVDAIQKRYPEHNIIDEETGVIENHSRYTWVIDPIDGTSNFAAGTVDYGIIIGLLKEGTPTAGGVALPAFSEIYSAERGEGAYLGARKLHVTEETRLLLTLVSYGIDGHQENPEMTREECSLLAEIILNVRNIRVGGSVRDDILLAKGNYGACLFRSSKIWDNVGTHVLIEEAGGLYTDFFGNPMNYTNATLRSDENFTVCAAPPALHRTLQEIIHTKR
jgi:myo-inositol-1(or 4)-monophosphatase